MHGATFCYWLILLTSAAMSMQWWQEAHAPMTAEKYARLCNDMPECYPEIGYFFGALLMGLVAVSFALTLCVVGFSQLRVSK